MHLYFHDAGENGSWGDTGNWFEDILGLTPHGILPGSGDDVSLVTGESVAPLISNLTVNLGSGVCDIDSIQIGSVGEIAGGTFTGVSLVNAVGGLVSGGVFSGDTFANNTSANISGGSFSGVNFNNAGGTISGGTFSGTGFANNGSITNGTFSGASFTNSGSIDDGLFSGTPFTNNSAINGGRFTSHSFSNSGTISGGTYAPADTLAYSSAVVAGVLQWATTINTAQPDPGFSVSGTYAPEITLTGVPSSGGGGGGGPLGGPGIEF